jgi:hypothetical protein
MCGSNKALALAASILFLAPFARAQERIDGILMKAVEGLCPSSGAKLVVSLGNFTYADKRIGSAFSRYLSEKLGVALTRSGRFEYFSRERLEELLGAAELSASDLFDPKTAVPVNLKGIQAVLSGTFFDAGEAVRVYLVLLDVGSGTLKAKQEVSILREDIPGSISVLPDNYRDAFFVLDELSQVQSAAGQRFIVKVWTPRGDGGTYRDGEKLVVHFYSNRDCYIRLYHIDVNKKMKLIFPNPYCGTNFLKAGKISKIPDESWPFGFDLTEPYGAEFIKVVASTVPFTDTEEAFSDLGPASRQTVARGLNVSTKAAQTAEAMLSYTIVR